MSPALEGPAVGTVGLAVGGARLPAVRAEDAGQRAGGIRRVPGIRGAQCPGRGGAVQRELDVVEQVPAVGPRLLGSATL